MTYSRIFKVGFGLLNILITLLMIVFLIFLVVGFYWVCFIDHSKFNLAYPLVHLNQYTYVFTWFFLIIYSGVNLYAIFKLIKGSFEDNFILRIKENNHDLSADANNKK